MIYSTFRWMRGEESKPIPSNPDYHVTNMGRVISYVNLAKSHKRIPHLLRTSIDDNLNVRVTISRNGNKRTIHVAFMVLTLFGPKPEFTNMVAGFRDGRKLNMRIDNLYWTFRKNQKLSDLDIKSIVNMYLTSCPPFDMVAKQYGVSSRTIQNIAFRKYRRITSGETNATS